ncbi:MAG: hypothetical protein WA705_29920 [Candidatus Ozemobacteraceae bacterium]
MGKYGDAALIAVRMLQAGTSLSPADAWDAAITEMFPDTSSSKKMGCPRGTFLGLCGKGLIRGISPNGHTRPEKNMSYGIRAVEFLRKDPSLASDKRLLWNKVIGDEPKAQNHQMDVVISLWENDLFTNQRVLL